MKKNKINYEIYAGEKKVWEGLHPVLKMEQILKNFPHQKISINWNSEDGKEILIL